MDLDWTGSFQLNPIHTLLCTGAGAGKYDVLPAQTLRA